ncbi:hypothetical protein [Paenibacillus sp. RC67]|uniref:hypothetical protein n=1 Tax=Paenibacillus sp. RC67 TaxID=3039392 RepID=UPI0024AE346F|nr:hypothetical protein [Paenibacillus sp. RC67]
MLVGGTFVGALSAATTIAFADMNIQAIIWQASITFNVKGTQSIITDEILNYDNKVYVPFRTFAEKMGASVGYTAPVTYGDRHMVDASYGEEKDFTLSDPDGYVSLGYLNFKPGGSKIPITGMVKLNKELPGGGLYYDYCFKYMMKKTSLSESFRICSFLKFNLGKSKDCLVMQPSHSIAR